MVSTPNGEYFTWGNKMMTLEQIKEKLKDRNLSAVADAAGVHRNAIYRLVNGQSNPSYETVRRLAEYLSEGKNNAQ